MKLDLILENVRNKYTMGLLEESSSEKETLQGKIILHEATMSIRNMLIEEGTMQQVKDNLEEAWTAQMIEETMTAEQAKIYNTQNMGTERLSSAAAGVPVVGGLISGVGQMHGGFRAGEKLGHEYAGLLSGREGALGATSMDPNSKITVGDAYSKSNILTRSLGGASTGALTGAMVGGLPGAAIGAGIGAVTVPAITPGLRYGVGKLFSGKSSL